MPSPEQGVVYRHTVESLVVQVVLARGAMRADELQALGVYPPRDVPIALWASAVPKMAAALNPELPPDEQLKQSGHEIVRMFKKGVVGVGLLMVLRMVTSSPSSTSACAAT